MASPKPRAIGGRLLERGVEEILDHRDKRVVEERLTAVDSTGDDFEAHRKPRAALGGGEFERLLRRLTGTLSSKSKVSVGRRRC